MRPASPSRCSLASYETSAWLAGVGFRIWRRAGRVPDSARHPISRPDVTRARRQLSRCANAVRAHTAGDRHVHRAAGFGHFAVGGWYAVAGVAIEWKAPLWRSVLRTRRPRLAGFAPRGAWVDWQRAVASVWRGNDYAEERAATCLMGRAEAISKRADGQGCSRRAGRDTKPAQNAEHCVDLRQPRQPEDPGERDMTAPWSKKSARSLGHSAQDSVRWSAA